MCPICPLGVSPLPISLACAPAWSTGRSVGRSVDRSDGVMLIAHALRSTHAISSMCQNVERIKVYIFIASTHNYFQQLYLQSPIAPQPSRTRHAHMPNLSRFSVNNSNSCNLLSAHTIYASSSVSLSRERARAHIIHGIGVRFVRIDFQHDTAWPTTTTQHQRQK